MLRQTIVAAAVLCMGAGIAHAGIVVTAYQDGLNVVFAGGGTINLGILTPGVASADIPGVESTAGVLLMGGSPAPSTNPDQLYQFISGPLNFGSGPSTPADLSSGDFFGLNAGSRRLYLPATFMNNDSLSGSSTFLNTNFATLGLTEGSTYVWSWGPSGMDPGDTFTLNVVPEPSTYAMLGLAAVAGLVYHRRKRRRAA